MSKSDPSLLSKSINFSNISLQRHTWERLQESADRFQRKRLRETSTSTTSAPLNSENEENGENIFLSLHKLPSDEKTGFVQSKRAHKTMKNLL